MIMHVYKICMRVIHAYICVYIHIYIYIYIYININGGFPSCKREPLSLLRAARNGRKRDTVGGIHYA